MLRLSRNDAILVLLLSGVGILLITCKNPYSPTVADNLTNILIVEGVINNGPDSTIIRLSRAVKLDNGTTRNPETNATVAIEDDQNKIYTLKETASGTYGLAPTGLNAVRNYRLRIKTTGGLEYLSDYEAVKNAPPIDTLGYNINGSGLNIYVNAHDATNNTRYYRWEYQETWRFDSFYDSYYDSDYKKIIPRAQHVHSCFGNDANSSIILATTTKLTQDVVNRQNMVDIPSNSEKVNIRYSILVKQYALTQNAYEFWENLQKNSETLGSVFDQQPSSPIGNIRCITNPAVPVVGYVSVGTVQAKRIFIDKLQLPMGYQYFSPYGCNIQTYLYHDPNAGGDDLVAQLLIPNASLNDPIDAIKPAGVILGFSSARAICVDCTLRGTTTQPSFWK